jgi:hypothetical protein
LDLEPILHCLSLSSYYHLVLSLHFSLAITLHTSHEIDHQLVLLSYHFAQFFSLPLWIWIDSAVLSAMKLIGRCLIWKDEAASVVILHEVILFLQQFLLDCWVIHILSSK